MKHRILCVAMALMAMACGNKNNPTGTDAEAPGVPSGVQLKSNTETSLVFTWSAVSGADSYQWRLLQGMTEVKSGKNNETEVTVTGLSEGTAYSFSVRSIGKGGMSAFSSAVSATTASSGVTPPDPTPGTSDIAYADFMIPETEEDGVARAFPGAEGGGMYTTGGRGGVVYHVTNLNDNGPGSLRYGLRYGLAQSGKRTIVFDVAGTIALNSKLNITKGDVTIAGQTAPGDGICLKNYTFGIAADNVIVRFIRFRMGDEMVTKGEDALQVMGQQKNNTHFKNIIIDHCSASWSTDECGSFYGMSDFTLQWCILSESLRYSKHETGKKHGYGGLWGGENATYHHNLLAHHDSRNPRLDHDYTSPDKGPVSLVNNVIYNWSGNSTYGGESINKTGTYRKYNIVGNYYKPGPATPEKHIWFVDPTTECDFCSDPELTSFVAGSVIVPGHFYLEDNVMDGYSAMTSDNWTGLSNNSLASQLKSTSVFSYSSNPTSLSIHSAVDGYDAVLSYSGASLKRDSVDERLEGETRNKEFTYTGSMGSTDGLIDSQTDVGGWPVLTATQGELDAVLDSDGDGIPDAVETAWGMNKDNASDGTAKSLDKNGRYTNLEMYLHYLVKDIVNGGNQKAEYKKL